MTWICMPLSGPCREFVSPDGFTGGDSSGKGTDTTSPVAISGPVGTRGNLPEDVMTIQDALNRVPIREGGASPPLDVDGKSGPKTQKAIQVFQLQHFGWKGADGLVEPGKQTLAKLNEILGSSGLLPAVPNLSLCIQKALSWIGAAQANLTAARPFLDSKGDSSGPFSAFSREARMRAVNQHFAIDSQAFRQDAFEKVALVYDRMLQAFRRPGGLWGPAVFTFDSGPVSKREKWIAYTPSGGLFRAGQWQLDKSGGKFFLDSIYLCPGFNTLWGDDMRAFVIVHELAHFVGHPTRIGDNAYNWEGNGTKISHLQPISRLLNAESYANFAHETGTGSQALLAR